MEIKSIVLSATAVTSFGLSMQQANDIGELIFTMLSILSVTMLIIINRKKFVKELRSMLDNCPDDENQEEKD